MIDKRIRRRIRVLVVDDSVLMGIQISKILSADEKIEVVGRAKDGVEALEMIQQLSPDVVTLDVEMPRMDGITALKHIMVRHPVPIIMVSSLTREGAKATFDALRFGALDVIAKPSRRETDSLEAQAEDIVTRVKQAANIGIDRARYRKRPSKSGLWGHNSLGEPDESTRFIGIGTGTGGYYSILQVIPHLRPGFDDVVLAVIRVTPRYIEPFVSYLEGFSPVPVRNIRDVHAPEKGACYLCSAQDSVILGPDEDGRTKFDVNVKENWSGLDGPINMMFRSLARVAGPRAVGVVMSGAGSDGADGIAAIRRAGGIGVVQAISNCMNPSMPRSALMKGLVEKILPDYYIADFLMKLKAPGFKRDPGPMKKVAYGG